MQHKSPPYEVRFAIIYKCFSKGDLRGCNTQPLPLTHSIAARQQARSEIRDTRCVKLLRDGDFIRQNSHLSLFGEGRERKSKKVLLNEIHFDKVILNFTQQVKGCFA